MASILRTVDEQIVASIKSSIPKPSKEDRAWAINAAMQIFGPPGAKRHPGCSRKDRRASPRASPSGPIPIWPARAASWSISMETDRSSQSQDPTMAPRFWLSAKAFLDRETKDLSPATFRRSVQTADLLLAVGLRKDAVAAFNLAADAAKASTDPKIAELGQESPRSGSDERARLRLADPRRHRRRSRKPPAKLLAAVRTRPLQGASPARQSPARSSGNARFSTSPAMARSRSTAWRSWKNCSSGAPTRHWPSK